MMNSIIKNNIFKKIFTVIIPIAFWGCVWQIAAVAVNNTYFLPTIPKTFAALLKIVGKSSFYRAVFSSFISVIIGLLIGAALGVALAILSHKLSICKAIVSPIISVIKATPVATFIIILWVLLDGRALPVFIAVMMVMPIIWQNVLDGFASVSNELHEVCSVFEFSLQKKIKLLIFPAVLKFFVPALITSSGLAWKAEIAAEIIAYTKNSIGQYIHDAKNFFDTPSVFALTLIIIILSVLIEQITKLLLRRFNL